MLILQGEQLEGTYLVKQKIDINLLHTIVKLENLDPQQPYEVKFSVVLFEGIGTCFVDLLNSFPNNKIQSLHKLT